MTLFQCLLIGVDKSFTLYHGVKRLLRKLDFLELTHSLLDLEDRLVAFDPGQDKLFLAWYLHLQVELFTVACLNTIC